MCVFLRILLLWPVLLNGYVAGETKLQISKGQYKIYNIMSWGELSENREAFSQMPAKTAYKYGANSNCLEWYCPLFAFVVSLMKHDLH